MRIKIINKLLSYDCLIIIMVDLMCEECYYKGNKTQSEEHNFYCEECFDEHAMCPKCGAPYHSATITE
jgi:hypothetical protein